MKNIVFRWYIKKQSKNIPRLTWERQNLLLKNTTEGERVKAFDILIFVNEGEKEKIEMDIYQKN